MQKELGYGYEVRFFTWPGDITYSVAGGSSCGRATTLPGGFDGIPIMHVYLGTGGAIAGEMQAPGCRVDQFSTLTWSFSVPAAKK
jgi:hypothetical protein